MLPKKLSLVCSLALETGTKSVALTIQGLPTKPGTVHLEGDDSPVGKVLCIHGPNEMVVSFDALDLLAYIGSTKFSVDEVH